MVRNRFNSDHRPKDSHRYILSTYVLRANYYSSAVVFVADRSSAFSAATSSRVLRWRKHYRAWICPSSAPTRPQGAAEVEGARTKNSECNMGREESYVGCPLLQLTPCGNWAGRDFCCHPSVPLPGCWWLSTARRPPQRKM